MKNTHILWSIMSCGLPLLFILLTPSFGIGNSTAVLIFIIAMFGTHLLIPMQRTKQTHSLYVRNMNQKIKKEEREELNYH